MATSDGLPMAAAFAAAGASASGAGTASTDPSALSADLGIHNAIDPAALHLPLQPFPDFSQLSAEQFDLLMKGAFGTDTTDFSQAGLDGTASSGDPSAALLLQPMVDTLAGLPASQFDFSSQPLGLPFYNPAFDQQQQNVIRPSASFSQSQLSIPGPSTSSSSATISPSSVSTIPSVLIGADSLSQPLQMAPMQSNPMSIDQSAMAAGWQVFGNQMPSTDAGLGPATSQPLSTAPPLLHLSQTLPEPQSQISMRHIPMQQPMPHSHTAMNLPQSFSSQPFQLQQDQTQFLHSQQQQQQLYQVQTQLQLQTFSTFPDLQHHHSFHHLPSSQQQDAIFGPANTFGFSQLDASSSIGISPMNAFTQQFPDPTASINHQLSTHQSLPTLALHYPQPLQQTLSVNLHPSHFQTSPMFMGGDSSFNPHTPASSVISAGSTTTSIAGAPGFASGSSGASSSIAGSNPGYPIARGGGAGGAATGSMLSTLSSTSMPMLSVSTHHPMPVSSASFTGPPYVPLPTSASSLASASTPALRSAHDPASASLPTSAHSQPHSHSHGSASAPAPLLAPRSAPLLAPAPSLTPAPAPTSAPAPATGTSRTGSSSVSVPALRTRSVSNSVAAAGEGGDRDEVYSMKSLAEHAALLLDSRLSMKSSATVGSSSSSSSTLTGGTVGAAGGGGGSSLSQPLREMLSSSQGRALLEHAARVRNERLQKYDEVSAALDTLRLYFKQEARRSAASSSSSGVGSSVSGRNASTAAANKRSSSSAAGLPADLGLTAAASSSSTRMGSGSGRHRSTPSASHVVGLGLGLGSSSSSSGYPHRTTSQSHHRGSSRNVSGWTAANTSGSVRGGIGSSSVISGLSSAGTLASSLSTNASSVRSEASRGSSIVLNGGLGGVVGAASGTSSIAGSPGRPHGHGHARTRSRRASSSLHRSFSGDVKSTLSEPTAAGQPYPSPYAHLQPHGHGKAHGFLHGHSHRSQGGSHSSPGRAVAAAIKQEVVHEDDRMSEGEHSPSEEDERLDVLDDISERVSRMKEEVQMALAEAAVAVAGGDASALVGLGLEGTPFVSEAGASGHDLRGPPG